MVVLVLMVVLVVVVLMEVVLMEVVLMEVCVLEVVVVLVLMEVEVVVLVVLMEKCVLVFRPKCFAASSGTETLHLQLPQTLNDLINMNAYITFTYYHETREDSHCSTTTEVM
ncbi:hypothetical protein EYF80_022640 [Liparis tanakae]|uniref:Uncharacterized protein n=1 Tax=Liparis tanakae TaxID=230148 RepID=A0A4Z2HND4_9TELE|nr:hypothetical protein EYF80_022640 [Liparis tanakae]